MNQICHTVALTKQEERSMISQRCLNRENTRIIEIGDKTRVISMFSFAFKGKNAMNLQEIRARIFGTPLFIPREKK